MLITVCTGEVIQYEIYTDMDLNHIIDNQSPGSPQKLIVNKEIKPIEVSTGDKGMISFHIFSCRIAVIDSCVVLEELFDHHGAIYSNR